MQLGRVVLKTTRGFGYWARDPRYNYFFFGSLFFGSVFLGSVFLVSQVFLALTQSALHVSNLVWQVT